MSIKSWLSPVFTCNSLTQDIKKTLSHALVYASSFLSMSILPKEKYILGKIGLYFGGFGEKLN